MAKALFWDFDGTLIQPNESFLDALKDALSYFDYRLSVKQIKELLHGVCSWYRPDISYTDKTGLKWWDNLFEHFDVFYEKNGVDKSDRSKIDMLFKEKIHDYRKYALYQDSRAVLDKCRQMGYENYILSNNFPELRSIISAFDLSTFFAGYIVSSNIGYEKPRLELFQYALGIANNPEHCYMIGDNPVADIEGGKAAGMRTILVHNDTDCHADWICKDLLEIPDIL